MRHSQAVRFDVWTHMIFRAKTREFLAVKSFVSKGEVERERRCHFSLLNHVSRVMHCQNLYSRSKLRCHFGSRVPPLSRGDDF